MKPLKMGNLKKKIYLGKPLMVMVNQFMIVKMNPGVPDDKSKLK